MIEARTKLEPVKRWVPSKKLWLLDLINAGHVTREQALDFYGLSAEELSDWAAKVDRYGGRGLRVTRLKDYRKG